MCREVVVVARRKKEEGELSPQEELFVAEYLKDYNASAAAIRAGYAESTAKAKAPLWVNRVSSYRVGKGRIYNAINAARMERMERVKIDQDYLLMNAAEILERCMQRSPVVNAFGKQVVDEGGNNLWRFDSAGANKAIENIAKLLGLNKEQPVQQSTNNLIFTDHNSLIYQAVLDTVRDTARAVREGDVLSGDSAQEGDITEV